tara:strand:- start:844 stop:1419 length:576 start_codon:yes stop_codon:yes gene_type:complete
MQNLHKINIKWHLQDPEMLNDEELYRIFNEWISDSSEEVLIDVADYKHLNHGPTTILIGHEANYFLESEDQTKGLVYARKQTQEGDLSTRLAATLRASLKGCIKLENHPELQGRLKFDGSTVRFTANDRLHAPNTKNNVQLFEQYLSPILDTIFSPNSYAFDNEKKTSERLTVNVQTSSTADLSDLLKKLT